MTDQEIMEQCLELAQEAAQLGEVPVAAIVVKKGEIIAKASNLKETNQSAMHHAEVLALSAAAKKLNRWRLNDCELFVNLEPCLMCAGAILAFRLQRLVYAAKDPKGGCVESLYQTLTDPRMNHQVTLSSGLLAERSSELLKKFFQQRRHHH